ncbi:hypothetical protein [Ruminococcus albus]|uniref:Uncharacterized protein n=1 Tax=Ruminococcus albus (strain ATCC 27210 / DSM 20455 / JCM 14654 / NCDO 2250 / 7) TaxID=697329 RepID=E6UFJ3_RUMA7|nr:hypothetical protein [Ruminococcus albus]ADU21897.1 hypothetical protein Rumal_1383 [Ruminococcus albus 7 = DSM 20455]
MGNFFHTVHFKIKDKEKFFKGINAYMKKKGFVPCDDDEAVKTYIIALSVDQQWATLADMDSSDESRALFNDAKAVSKSMKLPCITEVITDSDIAVLELFDKTGESADRIVVGDGEIYGMGNNEIKPECWKPLLNNKADIEKLIELTGESDLLADERLSKISLLFGVDMLADSDELGIRNDESILRLSFKKAEEKKPTLNTLFTQIYGEALEPLGFKKPKVRMPLYVRVIKDEIIHIVGIHDMKSHLVPFGAIATVYREDLCIDRTFRQNERWYKRLKEFYLNWHISDKPFEESCFHYTDIIDYMPLSDAVKASLNATITWILPVLDNVKTLKDVADYDDLIFKDYLSISALPLNKFPGASYSDAAIRFLLDDLINDLEKRYSVLLKRSDEANIRFPRPQEDVLKSRLEYEQWYNEARERVQTFLEDEEIHKQTMEELERRKEHNLELLRKYKII